MALNDSLNDSKKESIDLSSDIIIEDILKKEKESSEKLTIFFLATIAIGGVVLLLLYRRYRNKKKVIQSKNVLLKSKDETIVTYHKETLDIKNKELEELFKLAKKNDLRFYEKFNRLYPDFKNNILMKYPKLTLHDIKYCAYIKLGFSNKEIAEYTHVAYKTVTLKRYRIRKKANLDSKIDFPKWVSQF